MQAGRQAQGTQGKELTWTCWQEGDLYMVPGPGRGRVAEREVSPPFTGSALSLVCVGGGGDMRIAPPGEGTAIPLARHS